MKPNKPSGALLLFAFTLLGAVIALFQMLQYFHILPFPSDQYSFWGHDLRLGMVWGLLAMLYLWGAYAVWNRTPFACPLVAFLAGTNLLLNMVAWLGGTSPQGILSSMIINGVILLYALLPGTRKLFNA